MLEVLLKAARLLVAREPDGSDAFPREMLLGVGALAGVVFIEATLKVRRLADITRGWI